ncbi:MAG: hypothetical protein HQ580_13815 [Planctomycetes bacterium]|nr:hypothetical protein [Planctomycetota bacterium]
MSRNKKIILIVFTFIAICGIVICVQAYSNLKKSVKKHYQKVQFNSIQAGIELFNNENNGYPPSEALDPNGQPYCGAMKLCEAMMGRDMLGFHPDSVFRADGMDATNTRQLYPVNPQTDNTNARIGPILQDETANAYRLLDIYGSGNTGSFNRNDFVLCDEYPKKRHSGKKIGMPILYYKADTSHTEHDVNNPDNPKNIYNYKDNHTLLSLGIPWKPNKKHPLFTNPRIFYEMTKDRNVSTASKPNREDSFILISAGKDGLYGTADDICNFEWKYRE